MPNHDFSPHTFGAGAAGVVGLGASILVNSFAQQARFAADNGATAETLERWRDCLTDLVDDCNALVVENGNLNAQIDVNVALQAKLTRMKLGARLATAQR
jgi:hypothetical protein